jgi:hypothetical protein
MAHKAITPQAIRYSSNIGIRPEASGKHKPLCDYQDTKATKVKLWFFAVVVRP